MIRLACARATKRLIDIVVALVGLLVFLPVLIVLLVAIYWTMGRPVFFYQVRPGYRARPLRLLKLRTMRDAYEPDGRQLPDAQRLTRFGRFLRRTSLDEIPQLFNVLKGDLSLVGPRPLLMEYLPLYTPEQARRHVVRPGITGWAQVNGRNGISWEKRFALDIWYVDHWSLWLDLKILALTVVKVVRGEGITGAETATMARFTGSSGEGG